MKRTLLLILLLLTSFVCLQANAAFMNGSFEEFGMGQTPPGMGSFSTYSTLPGWTSEDSIEIHHQLNPGRPLTQTLHRSERLHPP